MENEFLYVRHDNAHRNDMKENILLVKYISMKSCFF